MAIAVLSSAVMEVLDTSVVNVSLPHIAGNLSATTDEATWVLTSYLVANAIILPMSGWLANYFGRKRMLLTVVTGFTVSSLLCGLAPSLPMLIFFRVLQGVTGGGLQPLSQAVLLEEFPPRDRGKAMALFGLGIVAAPILGPTLGGWITDTYTWRWVFYINLPVGITSLIMISLFVTDPPYLKRGSLRADFWGFGMLAVGMGALQIMLDKGQEDDWFGSRFIITLAVTAGVFLIGFIIRELLIDQPIVHLGLLKYRSFAAGIFLVAVLGFVLYSSLVLLPLFMQTLLGWTSATAGLWTSPRGIGTALCMPLVGYLLGKGWDGRWLLTFGFAVGGLSLLGFSHMNLQSGTWDILVWQISQGLGMSFIFVPLTTLTMDPIPKRENRLCHRSLQRHAEHRLQRRHLVRHDMARAPRPVQPVPAGCPCVALRSGRPTDAEPGPGDADAPWRRSRDREPPSHGDALRRGATPGIGAELPDGVSVDRPRIPGHDPADPDPPKAKAPQRRNDRNTPVKGRALIRMKRP